MIQEQSSLVTSATGAGNKNESQIKEGAKDDQQKQSALDHPNNKMVDMSNVQGYGDFQKAMKIISGETAPLPQATTITKEPDQIVSTST